MELADYQRRSRSTAAYPREVAITYPALGLAGEAGEVADHIKKVFRDDAGVVHDERRERIADELGDVLWYIAQLATELELDLEDVAQRNLSKLASRAERGVIAGSGDSR